MSEQPINTVAIISPGDMGHAVGRELKAHGLDVITCVKGRSNRTAMLARQAGLREVENLKALVAEADLLLSILVPAAAESVAADVAAAMRECGRVTHYIDCNAISPDTVTGIDEMIRAEGALCSDGSIIGFPPGTAATPRLYVSGSHAKAAQVLDGKGITVKYIGPNVGQASGIKMCYAAMTKGTFALHYALLIAAHRMELLPELLEEFESSQADAFRMMQQFLPKLPAKTGRWVAEMQQIAATFESLGVSSHFHEGAAEIYDLISKTALGKETPETIDHNRTLEATIAEIAKHPTSL